MVTTDKADYPPGSMVTVTGSGWDPGEIVELTFAEQLDELFVFAAAHARGAAGGEDDAGHHAGRLAEAI